VTGSDDRAARLWDVASGLHVGPLLTHSGPVLAAFLPGGGSVATLAEDGPLRLWDVPTPVAGSVPQTQARVEDLTGKRLDEKGILRLREVPPRPGIR